MKALATSHCFWHGIDDEIDKSVNQCGWMDRCSVGGVALLHAGHKTGLMCTTVYLWCQNHLFLHLHGRNNFCVCMYLVEVVWNYRGYSYSCFLSINWLSSSLTPTITVTPDLFWIHLSLQWLMSVKLNRPPKPEETQKDSNFNEKTITGTSGLAVGSHNHCTIWVGWINMEVSVLFNVRQLKFRSTHGNSRQAHGNEYTLTTRAFHGHEFFDYCWCFHQVAVNSCNETHGLIINNSYSQRYVC
jgi:hypothetical protein